MNPLGSESGTHFWPSAEIALALTLVLGFLAVWKPQLGSSFFVRLENSLARFAKRKALAIGILFLGVIAVRLAVLPLLTVPVSTSNSATCSWPIRSCTAAWRIRLIRCG